MRTQRAVPGSLSVCRRGDNRGLRWVGMPGCSVRGRSHADCVRVPRHRCASQRWRWFRPGLGFRLVGHGPSRGAGLATDRDRAFGAAWRSLRSQGTIRSTSKPEDSVRSSAGRKPNSSKSLGCSTRKRRTWVMEGFCSHSLTSKALT
jgi:hypothetical protein